MIIPIKGIDRRSNGITATVIGLDRLQKALNDYIPNGMLASAAKELELQCKKIMELSLVQTPIKTGKLRRSHYLKIKISKASVEVLFGFKAPYALAVHERLELQHPTGKARFLSDPVLASQIPLFVTLTQKLKQELRSIWNGSSTGIAIPTVRATLVEGEDA